MTRVHTCLRSRRQVLTVSGATLALPFLASLLPRRARANPVTMPAAVVSIALRNGQFARDFATHTPAAALQPVSDPAQPWATIRAAPLSSAPGGHVNDVFTAAIVGPYRGHLLHLDGLDHVNPLGHADSQLGFVGGNASFDQLAAAAHQTRGVSAPLASLELTNPGPLGAHTASFRRGPDGRVSQLPALVQPAAIFDRLFGLSDPSARSSARRSLDAAAAEADRLQRTVLSRSDAEVLGRYMAGLRDVAARLAARPPLACAPGARPPDGVTDLAQLADLQTSLAALAVSCGVRTVSLYVQTARLPDGRTYDAQWWHNESHAEAPSVPTFLQAQRWVADAYFMAMVRKLDQLGALERSVVFMNNDVSSGRLHNNENQPVMLAAGASVPGLKQRGVYVSYQRRAPGLAVPQTQDFAGLLVTQLFNTLLAVQGLSAGEVALPGEAGFGSTRFTTAERRARYQAVLPGAGLALPWVA
ncbi:MAG: DUF1552 domain-containing protein [Myxococcaceae bacterium]|nr:DUF1552 domain-containing protein [Myxococcaceae bacterium]MCA3013576.1 DUF1552 domain-containing protein [Myxococcaceae bacterium]